MLCLMRRPGQRIEIGPSISVWLVKIKGHQVLLGVEAPPEVLIKRPEAFARPPKDGKPSREHCDRPGDAGGDRR